jgi:hypothetical protein
MLPRRLTRKVSKALIPFLTLAYIVFISQPFSPAENKLTDTQASEKTLASLSRDSQIDAEFTPDLPDSTAFLHVSEVLFPGEIFLFSKPPEDLVFRNLRYPLPSFKYNSASTEEPELEHDVRGGDKEFAVQQPEFVARLPEWRFSET